MGETRIFDHIMGYCKRLSDRIFLTGLQRGDRDWTSESDVYGRQILASNATVTLYGWAVPGGSGPGGPG